MHKANVSHNVIDQPGQRVIIDLKAVDRAAEARRLELLGGDDKGQNDV